MQAASRQTLRNAIPKTLENEMDRTWKSNSHSFLGEGRENLLISCSGHHIHLQLTQAQGQPALSL